MTDQIVRLGPEYFPRPTSGVPVSGGSIYIGKPDTDPEIIGNQITVNALQENGSTVPISQPILTGGGGVPLYNGSPVTLLVSESYSLKVLDAFDVQVYYVPSVVIAVSSTTTVESVEDIIGLINISSPVDDQTHIVLSFYDGDNEGGGNFYWDSSIDKATATGGTIIDPDNIGGFDGTTSTVIAFLAAQGTGVGFGCWLRIYEGPLRLEWFGLSVIDSDITFPSTMNFEVNSDTLIQINDGVTLTIEGQLYSGNTQIFEFISTGKVVSGGGVLLDEYGLVIGGTVNIGSGEFYTTLQSCMLDLDERYHDNISVAVPKIEVIAKIATGHTVTGVRGIILDNGRDASWIRVQSVDAVVPVTLTASHLMAIVGGKSPIIDALFDMATSTAGGQQSGCVGTAGAHIQVVAGGGVINAPYRGLWCSGATCHVNDSVWDGAVQRGIRLGNSSKGYGENVSVQDCGESGLGVSSSIGYFPELDATGAVSWGAFAGQGAYLFVPGIVATGLTGRGLSASEGSKIIAYDSEYSAVGATLTSTSTTLALIFCDQSSEITAQNSVLDGGKHYAEVITDGTIDLTDSVMGGVTTCSSTSIKSISARSVNLSDATITGNSTVGIDCVSMGSSNLIATGLIVTGSGRFGIVASAGSDVNITAANITSTNTNIFIELASIVKATGATGTTSNLTPNTVTAGGILIV